MATGVLTGCCSLGSSSNSSTSGECRRPVTITMSSCGGGGGGSGVTDGLSFVCCCFGGEGACSFFGDLIRSSLLICRLPIVIGEAGGFEIVVWSGRSTPLLAGVCGVSGGVGGTVVCAVVVATSSELGGAVLLLGDKGVCGGGGAGPFSFFGTPFFSTSAAPLTLFRASAGSTGGNTGAGTVDVVGDDFLASLCTLLLLSLATAAAAADGGVVELGVVVAVDGGGGGDCAAGPAAAAATGFVLLSSSTGTGVDSFESLDDFDKDVGVSGSL